MLKIAKIFAKTLFVALLVAGQAGCGVRQNEDSTPNFTIGLELYDYSRGHEDLTRFAVDLANRRIREEFGIVDYFTRIPVGENGQNSPLPMIRGLFDTDWAITLTGKRTGQRLVEYYGVSWLESGTQWQEMPWLQSLHFLRNSDAHGAPFSLEDSLDASRENIAKAFEQAVRVSWDRDQSFYWLGHALHIVQDSFSKAHTRRTADYRKIIDICFYGESAAVATCRHPDPVGFNEAGITGAIFEDDRVWKPQPSGCNYDPTDRTWDCLKPEAKKASEVGAGLLALFARIVGTGIAAPRTTGYNEVMDFFVDRQMWNGGYFENL